jgi:hypothetical protein
VSDCIARAHRGVVYHRTQVFHFFRKLSQLKLKSFETPWLWLWQRLFPFLEINSSPWPDHFTSSRLMAKPVVTLLRNSYRITFTYSRRNQINQEYLLILFLDGEVVLASSFPTGGRCSAAKMKQDTSLCIAVQCALFL